MNTKDIQKKIEQEYDIPFVVSERSENGEPVFLIGPKNPGKELFQIRISFHNSVRMQMDFVPEKYSVPFLESMATRPQDNRRQFISYAQLMRKEGLKVEIRMDDVLIAIADDTVLPDNWTELTIHASKFAAFGENEPNYYDAVYQWGSLMLGMVLSLADIVPVDDQKIVGYVEGNSKIIETKRYERNRLNRKLCVEAKGYRCAICGFDFEEKYGAVGSRFIHVHHIVPVSQIGPDYVIDPLKDLIPVCPNCHAMLHKKDPPYLPAELKDMLL